MQNAKLHIFSTKMYHFYVLTRKNNKILPFIYIVSKVQKGNTKSLKNFQITKGCRFRHPFDLNNIELFKQK